MANWHSHRETVHFFGPKLVFSAFWHYKNKVRLSRGLDVKWHIPSTCLDASAKWLFIGIYSINRDSDWPCLETHESPQDGQNVHGFQVRTPICHIVPVSRAYPRTVSEYCSACVSRVGLSTK